MTTTIDPSGKIELPEPVRSGLGLKPGDRVEFDLHNGEWILRSVEAGSGLVWEGNVLVHRGVSLESPEEVLATLRDERDSAIRGNSRP